MPPQETTLSKEDVEGFEDDDEDLPIAIPKKNVSVNVDLNRAQLCHFEPNLASIDSTWVQRVQLRLIEPSWDKDEFFKTLISPSLINCVAFNWALYKKKYNRLIEHS